MQTIEEKEGKLDHEVKEYGSNFSQVRPPTRLQQQQRQNTSSRTPAAEHQQQNTSNSSRGQLLSLQHVGAVAAAWLAGYTRPVSSVLCLLSPVSCLLSSRLVHTRTRLSSLVG